MNKIDISCLALRRHHHPLQKQKNFGDYFYVNVINCDPEEQ